MRYSAQKTQANTLLHLPEDILFKIMEELDFLSLIALAQTNRRLRQLVKAEYSPIMQKLFALHKAAQVHEVTDNELALFDQIRHRIMHFSTKKNTQLVQYQLACLNAWNKAKTPRCYGLGYQDVARLKPDVNQPLCFALQAILLSRTIFLIKYVDLSDAKIEKFLTRHEKGLAKYFRLAVNNPSRVTQGLIAIAAVLYYALSQYFYLPTVCELLTFSAIVRTNTDHQVLIDMMLVYFNYKKFTFNSDNWVDLIFDGLVYGFLAIVAYSQLFNESRHLFNLFHSMVTLFLVGVSNRSGQLFLPLYGELLCRINIDNMHAGNEIFRQEIQDKPLLKKTINSVQMPRMPASPAPSLFSNIDRETRQELDQYFGRSYLRHW